MAENLMRERLSPTYDVDGAAAVYTNNKITTQAVAGTERFLSSLSNEFDKNVTALKKNLDDAFAEIKSNASDPTALAKYQAALAEYTLYRNAQSNAVKAYKDIDMAVVRNFN